VGFFVSDFFYNLFLAAHRIQGDGAATQCLQIQTSGTVLISFFFLFYSAWVNTNPVSQQ